MKKYSTIIAFFTVVVSFSQNYKGTLDTITQQGLHKIMVTSDIRSATQENFNSLRIKDDQQNEIPYVLIYNNDRTFSALKPIEIVSKKVIKDSITSVLLENKERKKQDYIALIIGNTKIIKRYNVYGSNNGKNWFGLVANRRLTALNSKNKTTIEKTISFPLNTYQFLRINFDDKNSLPINILSAGKYESRFFAQTPLEITDFKREIISSKDRKVTQLKFIANKTHKIDILSLNISTEFFKRNAKLIVQRTRKEKKRIETYNEVIKLFQLNSKTQNTFVINNLNEKEFSIEIDNQDNPELAFESAQLFQKPLYLVANLKEKETYNIIIDQTLKKPSYDLGNFISDKTKTINKVAVTNFSKIEKEKKLEKKPFWETKLFMWICIVVGGIIVISFAIRLLKDINIEEEER